MKYRIKHVEVEAIQWTGENLEEIQMFTGENYYTRILNSDNKTVLVIPAFEGLRHASVGDYIIKYYKNESYPCALSLCKPAIFEETYELKN